MPRWAAAVLAVAGNIVVIGILVIAALGFAVAAALAFGSDILAQL